MEVTRVAFDQETDSPCAKDCHRIIRSRERALKLSATLVGRKIASGSSHRYTRHTASQPRSETDRFVVCYHDSSADTMLSRLSRSIQSLRLMRCRNEDECLNRKESADIQERRSRVGPLSTNPCFSRNHYYCRLFGADSAYEPAIQTEQ